MAPEILNVQPYKGNEVDLFASAIVLFIMLTGNPPFNRAHKSDPYYRLITNNTLANFWKSHGANKESGEAFFHPDFKDLVIKML